MDPRKIWLKSQAELQASLAVSLDKDKSYESAIISYMVLILLNVVLEYQYLLGYCTGLRLPM